MCSRLRWMCDFLVGNSSFYELEKNVVLHSMCGHRMPVGFMLALSDNHRDRPLLHT